MKKFELQRQVKIMSDIPTRCVDPVVKSCINCRYGHNVYPDWVETLEDLSWCTIETYCIYGFDRGRPEDEPTYEEFKEFEKRLNKLYKK